MVDQEDKQQREVRRRYRVADMMVTMHSMLRDDYAKRAVLLDCVIFTSSVVIAALAFFDPTLFDWLPFGDGVTRIAIGIVAVIIFLSSIASWRVDWKGRADAHGRAAEAYAGAKFRLGEVNAATDAATIERALVEYEEIGRRAVSIPDKKFTRLKSEHLLKIHVSRALDETPGAPIRILRIIARVRHTREALAVDDRDQ